MQGRSRVWVTNGGCADGSEELERDEVWKGYPYRAEEDIAGDMEAIMQQIRDTDTKDPAAVFIIMTHCGPLSSATTVSSVSKPERKTVYSGSRHIDSLLSDPLVQERAILTLHGHTHSALGRAPLLNVPVFNPGAVKYVRGRSKAHV